MNYKKNICFFTCFKIVHQYYLLDSHVIQVPDFVTTLRCACLVTCDGAPGREFPLPPAECGRAHAWWALYRGGPPDNDDEGAPDQVGH